MERHLVGFFIFLLTFAVGTCAVNPRLVFLEEEEFKCFALNDIKRTGFSPEPKTPRQSIFPQVRRAEEA